MWFTPPGDVIQLNVVVVMPRVETWGPSCGPEMLNGQWSKRVCQTAKLAGGERPPPGRRGSTAVGEAREGHY